MWHTTTRRLLLTLLLALQPAVKALAAPPPPARLEALALAEDWQALVAETDGSDGPGSSPVVRALRAHGLVLANRNTDALRLFLSLDEPERQHWKAWTQALAARHPGQAIAQYLVGDAQARAGDYGAALQRFDAILGAAEAQAQAPLMKQPALVFIAKGTVLAHLNRLDESRVVLQAALDKSPGLAEAHAAMGNLMLMKRAQRRARAEFTTATELSRNNALAWNGLGCASYGEGDWEGADAAFGRATGVLALPLFSGNRRALLVAAENVGLPGMDNSPLLRVSDFLDWTELQARTRQADDLMRDFFGGPLPEAFTSGLLKELNKRLESCTFSTRAARWMELKGSGAAMADVLGGGADRCDPDPAATLLRNRLALEQAYPDLIARHTDRNPGMQLTLTKGFVEQMSYKQSLTAAQIIRGQTRMDVLYKPIANLLQSTGFAPLRFLGRQLDDHLKRSTETNRIAYEQKTGSSFSKDRVSGVSASLRQAFVDQGPWPVVNWFGLGYATPMEATR